MVLKWGVKDVGNAEGWLVGLSLEMEFFKIIWKKEEREVELVLV